MGYDIGQEISGTRADCGLGVRVKALRSRGEDSSLGSVLDFESLSVCFLSLLRLLLLLLIIAIIFIIATIITTIFLFELFLLS